VRRAVLVSLALAGLVAPSLVAQGGVGTQGAGAPLSQGQQAEPPKSTALILGQVIDGSSGQPIADAVVTLTAGAGARGLNPAAAALAANASPQAQQAMQAAQALAAQAAGRAGQGGPQRILTGADGRFVFRDLPPGQYQVAAGLTGYVASLSPTSTGSPNPALSALAAVVAAAAPQGSPTALALKEGELASNVKLRLWKQAVVSGTILDDAGQPAVGLEVQAVRRVMLAGRARYVPAGSTRTDDRGAYRISGLTPGSFLVVVPQAPVAIPAAVFNNLIDALTGGLQGGAGWAMLDLVTSGIELGRISGGARVGDYLVTTSGAAPLLGPDGHLLMFQTTFYPGATMPAQASVISLASGEERPNLNMQLRLVPTARITGVAMGPDGPVANLGIRLVVPGDGAVSDSEIDVASTLSRADGSFAFFGVPPGQFLLRAVKQPRLALPVEAMSDPTVAAMFGGSGASGTTETLFASETVTVSNDIDGLVLPLAPGFHVSGRTEFAGAGGRPLPTPAQMQTMTVTLMPVAGGAPATLLGSLTNPDRANAQGEFKTKGYAPGRYALNMTAPPGWQVKSAVLGGRDVLDAPLEITSADIAGIVVTFTDRMGQLSGRVSAPGEADLSEVSVMAFPYDYRGWIAGGMSARLSRSTRASRDGAYSMPNLPAGEYLVAAIDRASEGDMQDPAFVDALARIGTRVTVGSDPVTLDVTRARVVIR
jgi:protocatechuate 3,4-dioxygenase beta subunit